MRAFTSVTTQSFISFGVPGTILRKSHGRVSDSLCVPLILLLRPSCYQCSSFIQAVSTRISDCLVWIMQTCPCLSIPSSCGLLFPGKRNNGWLWPLILFLKTGDIQPGTTCHVFVLWSKKLTHSTSSSMTILRLDHSPTIQVTG